MRYHALMGGCFLLASLAGLPSQSLADTVTPAGASQPASANSQAAGLIQGVDLSKWQGKANFGQIKSAGKHYVFVKVTEGISSVDPDYAQNVANAREAGLWVGSYHFYVTQDTPQAQFANLSKHLSLQSGDLPPVVDIEVLSKPGAQNLTADLTQFLTLIKQKYGVKPIIYSGQYFANAYLSGFDAYPLWLAEYNDGQTPKLPLDWKQWTFWQYSQSGQVTGVNGPIDLNRFNGSLQQLNELRVK